MTIKKKRKYRAMGPYRLKHVLGTIVEFMEKWKTVGPSGLARLADWEPSSLRKALDIRGINYPKRDTGHRGMRALVFELFEKDDFETLRELRDDYEELKNCRTKPLTDSRVSERLQNLMETKHQRGVDNT